MCTGSSGLGEIVKRWYDGMWVAMGEWLQHTLLQTPYRGACTTTHCLSPYISPIPHTCCASSCHPVSVPTFPGMDDPDGDLATALGSSDMLRHAGVWMPWLLACRGCNGPALICRGIRVSADADTPLLPRLDGRLRPMMWLDGNLVRRRVGAGMLPASGGADDGRSGVSLSASLASCRLGTCTSSTGCGLQGVTLEFRTLASGC